MASHVPVNPLSQTVSLQRTSEPGIISCGEVRGMLPFLVLHMMNLIHQGTQLPQGTCDTEQSMVRMQLSELPCNLRPKHVLLGNEKTENWC